MTCSMDLLHIYDELSRIEYTERKVGQNMFGLKIMYFSLDNFYTWQCRMLKEIKLDCI